MLRITDKTKCCGCSACVSVCPTKCISLKKDSEGFGYPDVDLNQCVNCCKCEKVCPIVNKKDKKNIYYDEQSKEEYTHLICQECADSMPKVYVAYNKNTVIREDSTSGGIFSALAEYVFNRNGWVYGVIVADDKSIKHYGTACREDLYKFRGSKYVQSDMSEIYEEVVKLLKKDTWVLFSGTPCQVEALKRYAGKEYFKLITVDIFCHGVGSPLYWEKYVKFMEQKYASSIKQVKFREKTYGYNSACMAIYFENGKSSHKGHDDDLYWTAFSKCYIFRPSCYTCEFKTINHRSDFTIGDFWSSKSLPYDYQKANGCTLLISQSPKADDILSELEEKIRIQQVEMEEALNVNGAHMPSKLISSSTLPKNRKQFLEFAYNKGIDAAVKKYIPLSMKKRIKCIIKPILYRIGFLEVLKQR